VSSCPRTKTAENPGTIRQKLPKALSGTQVLQMLREREREKQDERVEKERRKKKEENLS